jgi:hypothetical protein
MIYFLRAPSVNLVKIGTSSDPERRFQELRLLSPVPCEVFAVFSGGHAEETEIHRLFSAYHSHGEWYHAVKPVIQYAWRKNFEYLWTTVAPEDREWAQDWIDRPIMDQVA